MDWLGQAVKQLESRGSAGGGFCLHNSGEPDPAATAWTAIGLRLAGDSTDLCLKACRHIASIQLPDGRISVTPKYASAYWPTSIAAIAFHLVRGFEEPRQKAVRFLLSTSGIHWEKGSDKTHGHDTSLPGWPWTARTHSWVEPTALAMLALRCSGLDTHLRMRMAVAMMLDRQLPTGGWNYGNTTVFGNMLAAAPESTGHALAALRGVVERSQVAKSIDLLKTELESIRTPLSLSWGIIALAAWGERPGAADSWLEKSFLLQERYGAYDTCLLAQLVVARLATEGLDAVVREGIST